jgi:glycogen debranching enzyme
MEDEQFFCLALDGHKQQVRSVTSNAGHCLWSGICDPEKAGAVARRLMAPDMFSGWGIRTLSSESPNFNPMSYHNGSVWPHDNAIIALGLRRAGYGDLAARLTEAMCQAGFRFSDARLPELFCGFARDQRFNSSPAAYVVSCSPQAWAAGALFMFIESLLDIGPGGDKVDLAPVLPPMFNRISLRNLRIGARRVDVNVTRNGDEVDADVVEEPIPSVPATA